MFDVEYVHDIVDDVDTIPDPILASPGGPLAVKGWLQRVPPRCGFSFNGPSMNSNKTVTLTHLNPVLGHLPAHGAFITYNRQLCVPVQNKKQPGSS